MPIVDVEIVQPHEPAAGTARALADQLGAAFGSAPGGSWVRLRWLGSACYAENGQAAESAASGLGPVFVTVLHAHPPSGDALVAEVAAVTAATAACLCRDAQQVHVQYAPPGAGRQAFGGALVR